MRTIERNYRKNPHTARFLQTFHSAIGSNGVDYRTTPALADENAAEYELAAKGDDLLDLVQDVEAVDLRSPAQADVMERLIRQLGELDAETAASARAYTDGMTEHGKWTPGREGTASRWIGRMIEKVRQLDAAKRAAAPVPVAGAAEIPAHYYGIHKDGEVKCYAVDYGKDGTKWAGFLFLNRISSDDRFAIRNPAEKESILSAIREDVDAARTLAAVTLRRCQRCHRTLSDTKNPYFAAGLGPDCGGM